MSPVCRHRGGRLPVAVFSSRVGAVVQEQSRRGNRARSGGCRVQRLIGESVVRTRRDVRTGAENRLGRFDMAEVDGEVEHGPAVGAVAVEQGGVANEQPLDRCRIAHGSRLEEVEHRPSGQDGIQGLRSARISRRDDRRGTGSYGWRSRGRLTWRLVHLRDMNTLYYLGHPHTETRSRTDQPPSSRR